MHEYFISTPNNDFSRDSFSMYESQYEPNILL